MPRKAKEVVKVVKAAPVKEEPKPLVCTNCEGSGMVCSVCKAGYDVI